MVLLLPFPFEVIARMLELEPSLITLSLIPALLALGLYIYLLILYITGGDKKDNRFGKNIYKKRKKRR